MTKATNSADGNRRPTPRPTYTNPQVIRRDEMAHHVWGDVESGYVSDRVISSTDQLHVLEFELPPGSEFRHSSNNQTIFAADVLYYCLQGEFVLANPQTGEVALIPTGTGRLFRRGTWHHGFNPGQTTVRVLEYFSPPPARGTASDFAKSQAPLQSSVYEQSAGGNFPMLFDSSQKSFWKVSDEDALVSFRDTKPSHLIRTLVDTEFLTVKKGTVYSGHVEEFKAVENESVIFALAGELWVDIWNESDGSRVTAVLKPGEAMYLPVGCSQRMLVRDHNSAQYLIGSGHVPAEWKP